MAWLGIENKKALELIHYLVVFVALCFIWIGAMNVTNGNLSSTWFIAFVGFIVSDQIAHKAILGEDYSLLE